jgi:hypothetical protein
MSPTLNAIMKDLAKAQPTNTFVANIFKSDIREWECSAMQTNATINVEEKGSEDIYYNKCCP